MKSTTMQQLIPDPGSAPEQHAGLGTAVAGVSRWHSSSGKRVLDLAGAVLVGLLAVPVFVLACLAAALTSGLPVLYNQVRLGRGMRPFRVYKIRTMRRDAEHLTGPVLATENDPRVTRVGRILRRTRLDELPQLYNVFRGEMSLVGPRPERPAFVREFMRDIPGYHGRYAIRPGLSGPAQVAESYSATPEQKLVHDLDYRVHASLAYDLRVLAQTVLVVLRASGR